MLHTHTHTSTQHTHIEHQHTYFKIDCFSLRRWHIYFFMMYNAQKMLQQIKYGMCSKSIGTEFIHICTDIYPSRRRLNIILHVSSLSKRFRFLKMIKFFSDVLMQQNNWLHRYLTLIKVSCIYLLQVFNGYVIHFVRETIFPRNETRKKVMITNWNRKLNGKVTCKRNIKNKYTINFRLVYVRSTHSSLHATIYSLSVQSPNIFVYKLLLLRNPKRFTNINISFVACTVCVSHIKYHPILYYTNEYMTVCVYNKRSDSFFGRHTKYVFVFVFTFCRVFSSFSNATTEYTNLFGHHKILFYFFVFTQP